MSRPRNRRRDNDERKQPMRSDRLPDLITLDEDVDRQRRLRGILGYGPEVPTGADA